MTEVEKQHRQGDLLFARVPRANSHPKRSADHGPILAHGEATGHTHQIAPTDLGNCDVFLDADGRLVVRVKRGKKVRVVHEEHGPIVLVPGTWEVRRQREYQPDGWTRVRD